MTDINTNHTGIEYFKKMASGVGGSYQRWQGEPPAHAVYMIKTDKGITTVKAYDLTNRVSYQEDVKIESGADGPNNIPFAHDTDYSELSNDLQEHIRNKIIEDFKRN